MMDRAAAHTHKSERKRNSVRIVRPSVSSLLPLDETHTATTILFLYIYGLCSLSLPDWQQSSTIDNLFFLSLGSSFKEKEPKKERTVHRQTALRTRKASGIKWSTLSTGCVLILCVSIEVA